MSEFFTKLKNFFKYGRTKKTEGLFNFVLKYGDGDVCLEYYDKEKKQWIRL